MDIEEIATRMNEDSIVMRTESFSAYTGKDTVLIEDFPMKGWNGKSLGARGGTNMCTAGWVTLEVTAGEPSTFAIEASYETFLAVIPLFVMMGAVAAILKMLKRME
ncbi:MAG: hypothetical protein AOA65_1303 [Candidatus Bathyarchaeota archaeon BA1]|nr:MAG: hypothetical protein AOA65_1303 [Candidatus Bathyarchaeota archaeon BA1]